jgi:hypothetical protein
MRPWKGNVDQVLSDQGQEAEHMNTYKYMVALLFGGKCSCPSLCAGHVRKVEMLVFVSQNSLLVDPSMQ